MADSTPTLLLICDDLFFSSKIGGTAAELGLTFVEADSQIAAAETLAESAFCGVIVDLAMPGLNVAELIADLSTVDRPPVIAFDSHVNAERMQSARLAGCDEVLPRSRFSATLPSLLSRFL